MRRTLGSILVLCLLVCGSTAQAFNFSFVQQEAILGEGGQISFVFTNIDGSGIDLTVTARDLTDGAGTSYLGGPYPYLDAPLSGRPGGLGVCQAMDCEGVPDDNLGIGAGMGEVVTLEFSAPIVMQAVAFNNGDHYSGPGDFAGSTGINVGASNPTTAETFSDIFAAAPVIAANLAGTRFSFVAEESFVGGTMGITGQVYIDNFSFVPEPGTALLLGMGLVVLSARGRRSA